jgi:hypothetical protein
MVLPFITFKRLDPHALEKRGLRMTAAAVSDEIFTPSLFVHVLFFVIEKRFIPIPDIFHPVLVQTFRIVLGTNWCITFSQESNKISIF